MIVEYDDVFYLLKYERLQQTLDNTFVYDVRYNVNKTRFSTVINMQISQNLIDHVRCKMVIKFKYY